MENSFLLKSLKFSDQSLLELKFKKLDPWLSEYSFANLFLFRSFHRYQLLEIQGVLFIKGVARDHTSFIMPTVHPGLLALPLLEEASSLADCLFPIAQNWLPVFDEELYSWSFQESESDYLFERSRLASLSGRSLQGQRNHIKQLVSQKKVLYQDLRGKEDALLWILDQWQKKHQSGEETDYQPCREAILNQNAFDLQGGMVLVDGAAAGFIMGERLSSHTCVVHFAKALVKGVYPYQLSALAKSLNHECRWINLEQDLGLSNLKAAKRSFAPSFLAKKWRVSLRSANSHFQKNT